MQKLFNLSFISLPRKYIHTAFKNDLIAAVNVALLAIPQGMAYALVAGLPVAYGIIGSGVASILGGLLGGKRFITLGPTNATAVLLFGMFANLRMLDGEGQVSGEGLLILPCVITLTALFLVTASILRISFFVKFISRTVITAYITAAALLIIINQLKNALGIREFSDEPITNFASSIVFTAQNLVHSSWPEISISVITICIYLLFKRFLPAFPSVAFSLALSSLIASFYDQFGYNLTFLKPFSHNSRIFQYPDFQLIGLNLVPLIETSLALALLCLIEGLSIGKSLASRCGERIESNRETLSFGLSNLGCGFVAGMPCSGSLTRSSLNINSGAKTRASNVFIGLIVIIAFVSFSNFIAYISLSALSTLVIFIGLSLIKIKSLKTVTGATRSDALTFAITFGTALLFSLQMAIFAGIVTSIILFLKKVAEPEMVEQGYNEKGELTNYSEKTVRPEPEVSIVHVEGELFFAAADLFYEQIRRAGEDPNIKVLILKLLNAHHLDATSVMALEELLENFKKKDCHVLLCGIRKDVLRIFRDSGVLSRMNRLNIFPHSHKNPTLATARAVKRAKELLMVKPKVKIFSVEKE
jgi:SulP family sulfate permease